MRARYLHTITLITHTPRHCAPPRQTDKEPRQRRVERGGKGRGGERKAVGQGVPKIFWYFEHVLTQLMHSLWRLLPKSVARAQISKQMDQGGGWGAGEGSWTHAQLDTSVPPPPRAVCFTYLSLVLPISTLIIKLCVYLIY